MIDLTEKRIVITGGKGFVGSRVAENLKNRGCNLVFTPSHAEYDMVKEPDIIRMMEDLKPEIIIHLAAVVGGIGANRENPGRFFIKT